MSNKNKTKVEKIIDWFRDKWLFAILIIAVISIIALGDLTDAISNIREFICRFTTCEEKAIALLTPGFDFIERASEAKWSNGSKQLDFPGDRGDRNGFVYLASFSQEALENGEVSRRFLEVHPKWVKHGILEGEYGPFQVPNNLKISCKVGFLQGAAASDGVDFIIEFRPLSSPERQIIYEQSVKYDGKLDDFTVDISSLKNSKGYIILSVNAGESSVQDWAVWLEANVIR